MFTILPFLTFLLLLLLFKSLDFMQWRDAFLAAATAWGSIVVLLVEVLSLFSFVSKESLVVGWGLASIASLFILILRKHKWADIKSSIHLYKFSLVELPLFIGILLIICTVGIIAWFSPPNTWDSMTYHMSRVMHWLQNQDISHYPTHILRQLHQNPWSELTILNFQLLTGSDKLANFVQWFSMLGSLIGVSLIAKELNLGHRGQLFSATICATIPMGILQGSSTQTDFVLAFWLTNFVYFAFQLRKYRLFAHGTLLGAALGLSVLTKATAYIFAFPFLLWLVIAPLTQRKIHSLTLKSMIRILLLFLIINLGHYTRNLSLYNDPLGPGQESPNYSYLNNTISVSAGLSNVMRNIGLHLGSPSDRLNVFLEKLIINTHDLIRISIEDPGTTWPNTEFHITRLSYHEDLAGNPTHLVLFVLAIYLYIFHSSKSRPLTIYLLAALSTFILFSFILKWQPWHSRLHLPIFVLISPFMGAIFSRPKIWKFAYPMLIMLVLLVMPWVFKNQSKPLIGQSSILNASRIEQYFANNKGISEDYQSATLSLADNQCFEIGLILGVNDWEYPLWVMLNNATSLSVNFTHVQVKNVSSQLEDKTPEADICGIITLNPTPENLINIGQNTHELFKSFNTINVYLKTQTK